MARFTGLTKKVGNTTVPAKGTKFASDNAGKSTSSTASNTTGMVHQLGTVTAHNDINKFMSGADKGYNAGKGDYSNGPDNNVGGMAGHKFSTPTGGSFARKHASAKKVKADAYNSPMHENKTTSAAAQKESMRKGGGSMQKLINRLSKGKGKK